MTSPLRSLSELSAHPLKKFYELRIDRAHAILDSHSILKSGALPTERLLLNPEDFRTGINRNRRALMYVKVKQRKK